MVFKLFLLTISLANLILAATKEEDFFIHNHSDDYDDYEYDDEVRNVQTEAPANVQTEKPATYEVTENVDDIPNNVTYKGPVVPNFTIKPPIFIATEVKNTTNVPNNNSKENNDKDGLDSFFNGYLDKFKGKDNGDKVNKNLRKNSISIFHVNAEFDDEKPTTQHFNIHKIPNIGVFNVKEQVDKFKDGIVNHIYNVHNNEVHNEVHGFLPSIVAGPIAFLGRLHRKGSAVASRLHNAIFGNFDEY